MRQAQLTPYGRRMANPSVNWGLQKGGDHQDGKSDAAGHLRCLSASANETHSPPVDIDRHPQLCPLHTYLAYFGIWHLYKF